MFVDLFDHTSSQQWSLALFLLAGTRRPLKTCLHDIYTALAHTRPTEQLNNLRTESDYMDFGMIASHARTWTSTSPPPEQIILHISASSVYSMSLTRVHVADGSARKQWMHILISGARSVRFGVQVCCAPAQAANVCMCHDNRSVYSIEFIASLYQFRFDRYEWIDHSTFTSPMRRTISRLVNAFNEI